MTHKTVIVTGGCGFIGRYIVPRLCERGFNVHILSRSIRSAQKDLPQSASLHAIDLHNHAHLKQLVGSLAATHLVHLAWDTRHGMFWTSPENQQWVTTTSALLDAFIEGGGTRVVAAGTCAEYDWECGNEDFRERSSRLHPSTLYGQCKLMAREHIFAKAHTCGISAAWGRIFFLFGPHEDTRRLVSSAAISLLAGVPFKASLGDQIRDYSFVQDVADGFVALLASDVEGDVNIASGEPHTVGSILSRLAHIIGRPELLRLGEKPKQANEPARLVASVERLREEVGFVFPFSIDERLGHAIDWWRKHG